MGRVTEKNYFTVICGQSWLPEVTINEKNVMLNRSFLKQFDKSYDSYSSLNIERILRFFRLNRNKISVIF